MLNSLAGASSPALAQARPALGWCWPNWPRIFYMSSFRPTLMFSYQDGMEQWQDLGGRGLKFIDVRPGRGLGEIPTTYKSLEIAT